MCYESSNFSVYNIFKTSFDTLATNESIELTNASERTRDIPDFQALVSIWEE